MPCILHLRYELRYPGTEVDAKTESNDVHVSDVG